MPPVQNAHIYEINIHTWLYNLRQKYNRPITLATIPEEELFTLSEHSFDYIWLMGIWQRSPCGTKIAREHEGLQAEYRRALPDYQPEDVIGSPYCVKSYTVDMTLGTREDLLALRERLKNRGMGLILDFVPNHVACDHAWLDTNPDYFIRGTAADLETEPPAFFKQGEAIFAHGRDPYFPAWTDVAQLNAFDPDLRQSVIQTLCEIATLCDGVRCDMAMLMCNRIFANTWGERAGEPPEEDFWEEVIPKVRAENPAFLFVAEVYWGMEAELMAQGFDYCYDKTLYDRLIHENAQSIHDHLIADVNYQNRLVRFIENHDEKRVMALVGEDRSRMAALLVATLPGAVLWHEGQFEGYMIKLPVQLGRRPVERINKQLVKYYRTLIGLADKKIYRQGTWQLRQTISAWPNNETHRHMIAYTWVQGEKKCLVVVNYSNVRSQTRVRLSDLGLENKLWILADVLNEKEYEREGDDMVHGGLYIDLYPWSGHIFKFNLAE